MSNGNESQSIWLKGDWKADEGCGLDLRDHLWLLDLTLDYQAQLIAIHSLLNRNRATEAETAKGIKEIEEHARNAADDILSERAVEEWIDRLHSSTYEDAAHSMAAIGMLAPFVESLFYQCFRQIGVKFEAAAQKNDHLRWKLPLEKRWDCHFVAKEKAVSKDVTLGILQLIEALNLAQRFPADLSSTLDALFGYRNKMFHHGFEWPIDETKRFEQRIADEGWTSWFGAAQRGEEPWLFYVSEKFISHLFALIEAVLDAFSIYVRDDLLPRHKTE